MTARRPLTTQNKAGLFLTAVLGVADVGLARTGLAIVFGLPDPEDEANLSFIWGTLIAGAVLASTTIAAVAYTWLSANRIGTRIIAGTRILSMLLAAPVFVVAGVDEFGRVFGVPTVLLAAGHFLVTIIALGLVLSRPTVQSSAAPHREQGTPIGASPAPPSRPDS